MNIINNEAIHLIENEYNLKINAVKQLFTGADRNSFLYRIESGHISFFLKVRTGIFNESSVIVPHLLSRKIGKYIIEPLRTKDGLLFLVTAEFTAIIYPFIFGKSGFERKLSDEQWAELGGLLHDIHNFSLPDKINDIPQEKYNEIYIRKLKSYMKDIDKTAVNNKTEKQFMDMLVFRRKKINEIIIRAEELLSKISGIKNKFCLCHGDIHAGNLFISENGEFYITDWDTMIMAPKERDLMFFGVGIGGVWNEAEEEKLFYKGYGIQEDINHTLMAYYRYMRIIEDIAEFYEQILTEKDGNRKKEILRIVDDCFRPHNIAEMAELSWKNAMG